MKEYYAVFVERTRQVSSISLGGSWSGDFYGLPSTRSEKYTSVIKFETDQGLKDWIINAGKNEKYEVVICKPVEVEKTVTINVSIKK